MILDYDIKRIYNEPDFRHPHGADVVFFSQELVDDINTHVAKAMGLPEFERTITYYVNEDVYKAIVDRCIGPTKPYIGAWAP